MLPAADPASLAALVALAQGALLLTAAVTLPLLGALAMIGVVTSIFQATTQVHDPAIGHFPRLIVAVLVLATLGPWMGRQLATFALRSWGVQ